jgi:hypothetical protein
LRVLVFSLALTVVGAGFTAAPAIASKKQPTVAQLGATWVANEIVDNGGYLEVFGVPSVTNTAYAIYGLHAAKIGGDAQALAIAYLKTQVGALQEGGSDSPGALAQVIMAAVLSGENPRAFGGTGPQNDLVARLLATQQTSGPDAGLFGTQDAAFDGASRQGFALLALKAVKTKAKDAHVVNGIAWLTAQQCANGLWQAFRDDTSTPCPPADPDFFTGPDTNSSAMAIQGLAAWGKKPHRAAALAELDAVQSTDGGWSFMAVGAQPSDPNSTALVIQALVALGKSPKSKKFETASGGDPYRALASYQLTCADDPANAGAFFFPGSTAPNEIATVQAVPAAAGKRLLVHKAKLKDPVAACPA